MSIGSQITLWVSADLAHILKETSRVAAEDALASISITSTIQIPKFQEAAEFTEDALALAKLICLLKASAQWG